MPDTEFSKNESINNALNFLVLDAEMIAADGGSIFDRYDSARLFNIKHVADYVRLLEQQNEKLKNIYLG